MSHHHPPEHGPHKVHAPPPHVSGLHHAVPVSRLLGFVDSAQLDARLAPVLPDAGDRAFVLRCLVGEGPLHHRGANYVLLSLLAQVLERLPAPAPAAAPDQSPDHVAVPMRLPPHLGDRPDSQAGGTYPLSLPLAPLRALAGTRPGDVDAMVDCLTDGPPQHALANVLMVALLERLLAALPPQPAAQA